ncbi:MAG: TetR/AcrR family transcriptional regulator [Solirubrobacterales bacterium]
MGSVLTPQPKSSHRQREQAMTSPASSTAPSRESPLEIRDQLVRAGMIGPGEGFDDPNSTRQRVLEAAIRLFADRGFDACTMRDLGREVGVKAPAIYNYYDSKEHILAAASRDALRRFFTAVIGPLAEDPEEERLERVVRRWVAFQIEEREIARANDAMIDTGALKRLLPKKEWKEIASSLRHLLALMSVLLDVPPGTNPHLLVGSIAAVCDRSWHWRHGEYGLSQEEVADQVWLLCQRMTGLEPSAGV